MFQSWRGEAERIALACSALVAQQPNLTHMAMRNDFLNFQAYFDATLQNGQCIVFKIGERVGPLNGDAFRCQSYAQER